LKCFSISSFSTVFLIFLSSAFASCVERWLPAGIVYIYEMWRTENGTVTVLSSSAPLQLELELQSLDLCFWWRRRSRCITDLTSG
jgi:hypothetical protein